MKNLYVIAVLVWLGINVNAQAPEWEWARKAGGGAGSLGKSISTDFSGNIYVTGYFYDAGEIVIFGETAMYSNVQSVFIVKYDSAGYVIWANEATTNDNISSDAGNCIKADGNGDVYLAGFIGGHHMYFGDTLLANPDGWNIFIAKYDSSGKVMWVKGPEGIAAAQSISTDADGNAYITGGFSSARIIFGNDTLTLLSGITNAYVVSYTPYGNVLWARSAIGNSEAKAINTDTKGNSYITGSFSNDTVIFGNYVLTKNDSFHNTINIFTVKYDTVGNVIWAKSAGQNKHVWEAAMGKGIATDADGNVYVRGYFSSRSISFGDILLTNGDTSGITEDIFIVKYDSSGNVIWAKGGGKIAPAASQSISTDAFGNVYVVGCFPDTNIVFGNDTLINASSSGNNDNIFIVKYDESGNVIWAKSAGGASTDFANGITDDIGNVYISGYFRAPEIIFNNDTLVNHTDKAFDFYIAKLGSGNVTSITDPVFSPVISVFPNPSIATFNFSQVNPGSSIQIYNVLGEIIYSSIANSDNYRINLNSQAKGIYFYRVSDKGNDVGQGKIVLE